MFQAIVQHTPVWVGFLLPALVALGLLQTRTRQLRPFVAALMPVAFLVLSLVGMRSTFGAQPLAWAAWAAGLAAVIGTTLAFGAWRGIRWLPAQQRFDVPGSWAPLVVILSIFVFRFVLGAALAISPALARQPAFATVAGMLFGVFSGVFIGRGLVMLHRRRDAQPLPMPAWAA